MKNNNSECLYPISFRSEQNIEAKQKEIERYKQESIDKDDEIKPWYEQII